MKKIISLMMALCMLIPCGVAMAETEVNWDDFEPMLDEIGLGGQWVTYEDWDTGFFLPSIFQEVEVPQELADQGTLALYSVPDGSGFFVVKYTALPDGVTDAESYCAALQQVGYADAEVVIVNGYVMVTYTDTEGDQLNAMSIYDDGSVMAFGFAPASDEGFQVIALIMMASLMTYDEAVAIAQ